MLRTIIVNGRENDQVNGKQVIEDFDAAFELDRSVVVSNTRSISSRQEMVVTSEGDIVEIKFEDQTTWIGNAQEFQEIFHLSLNRGLDTDALEVPSILQASDQRGIVQDLAINVFNLFKPKKTAGIVGAAVQELAKKLEEKVQPQPGLYLLDNLFRKKTISSIKSDTKPYLLFIHGTNSNTEGAFGKMVEGSASGLWKFITTSYGENILAFDHKTLTESPLLNTLQLLQQLPDQCTLHLITHSRGGLVGDLVARLNSTNDIIGFSDVELDLLKEREEDHKNMLAINELVRKKSIKVDHFIRVASPSMGTSLLSERLDHYLNTLLNLVGISTGLKANPIYYGVKALLAQVASSKTDVGVLPGLEAMSPESLFIKMLNNPANIIDSPLTVISGNCKVHLELKAMLIILTKLYFRRKNDLVVDTWSMYFGTPRKKVVRFFLDDEQGIDHTHYFSNKTTQDALLNALSAKDETILGFQPLEESDIAEANRNAALPFIVSEVTYHKEDITGTKPIAIILPGIMGSNLYANDDRIWVDFWRFVKGDLVKLGITEPNITAKSLMGSGYRKLANFLTQNGYEVVPFAYDWRQPLADEAVKLDKVIQFLLSKNKPIHVLAHSMGGVLFREFMLLGNEWTALNNSSGFKALFLGAPLGGSYLIPETLTGRGGNINKLSKLDLRHTKKQLLEVFAKCPGLYNLLPLSSEPHDFGNSAIWKSMLDNTMNIGEPPSDGILRTFNAFRKRALDNEDKLDYKNIIYIAGKDDSTTATFVIEDTGRGNDLVFKTTAEGDGSVTWESGIPKALIKKEAVYYCNTTHGELANDESIFAPFLDLLRSGQTSILRKVPPISRGVSALIDKPKYEIEPIDTRNLEAVVLNIKPKEKGRPEESLLQVTMSNGDLKDASYPLLIGHFYKDGILSAERALDVNLNNVLSKNHALNLYPGQVGTYEVFFSYNTCPKGAIVVGLGEPGELNGYFLELSVTQGISKFLLKQNEFEIADPAGYNKLFKTGVGVSALIVGGGYGGLSIENSIRSIILGIKKANEGIKSLNNPSLKVIERLEFIEVYEDRSLQAFYTIKKLATDGHLNIVLSSNRIKKLFNAKKRVPLDEQTDWWQRISVSIEKSTPHDIIKFSASTTAAREELRNLNSNPDIIHHFIDEASTKNHWSPKLAKTIFELLIPNDFKDAVRNQYNILWKLDKFSAAFPWELLEDTSTQSKPLCVNAGMIRQLATSDYRTQVKRSYKNNALVIGDPQLDGFAHQLAGAEKEAKLVQSLLDSEGYQVTPVINGLFSDVIQAIFQDEYRVIHLAGHGYFDPANPENAGMVIGNNLFLTSKEINQMSQVPEFVFVNCCHLGNVDEAAEKKSQQLYKLAANLGVQLIEMGVKAVIAAGWAVDDASALLFSETFYKGMFAGVPFGEAVKAARSNCYNTYPTNNTWGAYQCYGDQFYKFKNLSVSIKQKPTYILPMEVEVDMNNLLNKVESDRYSKVDILGELTNISDAIDRSGLRDGNTTEMEARILAALNEKEKAIDKIRTLRRYEDANYTVKALESLCNLSIKVLKGAKDKTDVDVKEVIRDFEMLIHIGGTCERYSLLASAYKTLFEKTTNKKAKLDALEKAAFNYYQAFNIAKQNNSGVIYPLSNWLQIESILMLTANGKATPWGSANANGYTLPKAKQAMSWMDKAIAGDGKGDKDLQFWDLMANANVLLTKLCMEPNGALKVDDVFEAISEAWSKGGSKSKKESEVEHLEFLMDALNLSKEPKAQKLEHALSSLKKDLEKLF